MFQSLEILPEDPILGLTQAFRNDMHADKIDLGVGVYKLADGSTPIMKAVREAEKQIIADQTTKSYTPPSGYPGFTQALTDLVFGELGVHVGTVQTPGGCGALRLAGELLVKRDARRIIVGTPTWANHVPLMAAAGLTVEQIPYYDVLTSTLQFDQFLTAIKDLGPADTLLLHGACHNPTGADMTLVQHQAIAELALANGFLVFIDTAYHGFASDLDSDVESIRMFASKLPELIVSYSCSKNFGLYRERTGAIFIKGATTNETKGATSHLINIARGNYSMPPAHGGAIVTTILQSPELMALWRHELTDMAHDVRQKRQLLANRASDHGLGNQLNFIERQNGMFSLLPLSSDQVKKLRDQFGIYMTGDGRINLCGLTKDNVDNFCRAYASVTV